jgi:hypothetical protein
MPTLNAFYRRYHAEGLEMVGISIDFQRDLDIARRMAKTVGYPTAHAKSQIMDSGRPRRPGVESTSAVR